MHNHDKMIDIEEALKRILKDFVPLESENKPILSAQGQILSKDILGQFNVPSFDNSAMDGFAVVSDDTIGSTTQKPSTLKIIGSVSAGEISRQTVKKGTAIRIMTGAAIPKGANAVVPFEETDEVDRKIILEKEITQISIRSETKPGTHIRLSGQDIQKGEKVLSAGTALQAADIGVLASLGYEKVDVIKRPKISILSTGKELIEPGGSISEGKIYDSNSYSVAAAAINAGALPTMLGIAGDDRSEIIQKLEMGLDSDMIITSAGVSVGDYDIVKDVLSDKGKMEFWSVKIRPSKPLAYGNLLRDDGKNIPLIGLPGNPVSALIGFELFGRPAIHKMLGKGETSRPIISAILQEPIYNYDGRKVFSRAVISKKEGVYYAKLTGHQGSNLLTSMSKANGLVICPSHIPVQASGESVDVQMTDWPEEVF